MTREQWRQQYRQLRIVRRETLKATSDAMLFGTGAVLITHTPDYIEHVPLEKLFLHISST